MARRKLELTWEASRKRWRKMYKGKVHVFAFGNSKADMVGYRLALAEWHKRKAEIDGQQHWDKPNGDQYRHAIESREKLVEWHEQQSELDLAQQYREEIADLRKRYELHRTPSELDGYDLDPLDGVSSEGRIVWQDRLTRATSERNDTTTIANYIDQFLAEKKRLAKTGQITAGWYEQLDYRLRYLRRYAGGTQADNFSGPILASYHGHLLDKIDTGEITPSYGKGILTTCKQFVLWMFENEHLETLPRNLRRLSIADDLGEIETFEISEIQTLLAEGNERMRLYVLLMLNCGMCQGDLSALGQTEVDWQEERIKRKRTKTKREKQVPIVDYKLWPETFELLRKHRSDDKDRVLLTENGTPLVVRELLPSGKVGKNDNVRKAYERLCRNLGIAKPKPLKLLRKTSATLLETHEQYGRYSQYFLGHAPSTVAEKRYAKPSGEVFDLAVEWLGEQYGLAE